MIYNNLFFIIFLISFNILIMILLLNKTKIAPYTMTDNIIEKAVIKIVEFQLHRQSKQIPTIPIHPTKESIIFFKKNFEIKTAFIKSFA